MVHSKALSSSSVTALIDLGPTQGNKSPELTITSGLQEHLFQDILQPHECEGSLS